MRWFIGAAVGIAAAGACRHDRLEADVPIPSPHAWRAPAPDAPAATLTLRDGDSPQGATPRLATPTTSPLSDTERNTLLSRLEPLPGARVEAFSVRSSAKPPPVAGDRIDHPLGAPTASAPEVPSGPLQVLRHAPEGDVPLAPKVSVTFDRPFVPLTSAAEGAAIVPVQLEPQPPGSWRWVGTRTLLFEAEGRLPMATTYTLRVPAGTTSAAGDVSETDWQGSFQTPPPQVRSSAPHGGPTALQPLVFLGFDQEIDREAIAGLARLESGRATFPHRLATPDEVAEDDVHRLVDRWKPGRWVALRPTAALPTATTVQIVVPEGTPSAEGPRTTTEVWSHSFTTHGPLRLEDSRCNWGRECTPGGTFQLTFSNPLVSADLPEELVSVTPTLPGLTWHVSGQQVVVRGASEPHTAYTVRVGAELTDVFGQALGEPVQASFKTTAARPVQAWWRLPQEGIIVLDPAGPPQLEVLSQGRGALRMRVHRVTPADWPAWAAARNNLHKALPDVGELLADQRVTLDDAEQTTTTALDLASWVGETGQLVVTLDTPAAVKGRHPQRATVWVQRTRIGLTAFVDHHEVLGWATDLVTGQPVDGVEFELLGGPTVAGDANGLASLSLPEGGAEALVARKGDDVALLPAGGGWSQTWRRAEPGTQLAWFVFDDRHLYRPDETVSVKGWVRTLDLGEGGDLMPPDTAPGPVSWTLRDARGQEVAQGEADVDAWGGFALTVDLPDDVALGDAYLQLRHARGGHGHGLEIREFRRPTFEVAAEITSEGPHVQGSPVLASAKASYYAGGALPSAEATWTVTASTTSWRPPGWDGWQFGTWVPWWRHHERHFGRQSEVRANHAGRTDPLGTHRLSLELDDLAEPAPLAVQASARILDVDRQAVSASTSLLLHPADVYVGVRLDRPFVAAGKPVVVELAAAALDGAAMEGRPISLTAIRTRWKQQRDGSWGEDEVERHACDVTSDLEPVTCRFRPEEGGRFHLTARITDAAGRANRTTTTVWVSGGTPEAPRNVSRQEVTLVPDKATYAPGEVAEVLIQTPFAPADVVVLWNRSGRTHEETLHLEDGSGTARIPIEQAWTPGITLQVEAVGSGPRLDEQGAPTEVLAPAFATGSISLSVPPLHRTLTVEVLPAATRLTPGADTSVRVVVRDASGAPVAGAQVATVIVDEAVLALTGKTIGDPVAAFHPPRQAGVRTHHTRGWIRLAQLDLEPPEDAMDDGEMMEGKAMPRMRSMSAEAMPPPTPGAGGSAAPPIAVRTDFRATALWVPSGTTGADGSLVVPVSMPDSLTRYRITAVAVDRQQSAGVGEADVTARLPLMVRPSPPRFLNFGDEAELPFVVHNPTDTARTVQLVVRGANLEVAGGTATGHRFEVPANDRVEVRVPTRTLAAGTAHVQVAVAAGTDADAAAFQLPVWTPATREAFATYGSLDGPRGTAALAQPLSVPANTWPQFGGLEVSTSTTQLASLTDAVLHLVEYPYSCSEQLASRILAVAALREVLEAFDAEGLPEPDALVATVQRDIDELTRRQRDDGGWGFWRRDRPAWPYLTLHATHALVRASEAGFTVPERPLGIALKRARGIEHFIPEHYGQAARDTLIAYSLHVRDLAGQTDEPKATRLLKDRGVDGLSLEALGWMLPSLAEGGGDVAGVVRHLENRADETAATAQFTTSYTEDDAALLLHGKRRTDAVVLEGLLRTHPDHDLLPKVVRGLSEGRVKGAWGSTQEDAFVLLALRAWFRTAEGTTPDLTARLWLGDDVGAEARFSGRSTDVATTFVPMAALSDVDLLTMARDGVGRLYYRLGLRYAPKSLQLDPAEHGFAVTRTYESVDADHDVWRDDEGTWHVKAGTRVRTRIRMAAPARRVHVALSDPLPAGLEVLDPALATTEALPPDATPAAPGWLRGPWWWWGPWYGHQSIRDERVDTFATRVPAGVHEVSWIARATTPGSYIVPPTRAEEMYHPETFGRSGTDRLVVEP